MDEHTSFTGMLQEQQQQGFTLKIENNLDEELQLDISTIADAYPEKEWISIEIDPNWEPELGSSQNYEFPLVYRQLDLDELSWNLQLSFGLDPSAGEIVDILP